MISQFGFCIYVFRFWHPIFSECWSGRGTMWRYVMRVLYLVVGPPFAGSHKKYVLLSIISLRYWANGGPKDGVHSMISYKQPLQSTAKPSPSLELHKYIYIVSQETLMISTHPSIAQSHHCSIVDPLWIDGGWYVRTSLLGRINNCMYKRRVFLSPMRRLNHIM